MSYDIDNIIQLTKKVAFILLNRYNAVINIVYKNNQL